MPYLFYRWFIPFIWVLWAAYWWLGRRQDKPVERRESYLARASYVAPLLAAVTVFLAPPQWFGPLAGRFLHRGFATYWSGTGVLLAGLGVTVWARAYLGGNWSGTVTIKRGHELVRTGPYRRVRHPIYSGLLAAILGCTVALGEWRGLLAFGIIFAALHFKLRREERWMTERFGHQYQAYRRETRALVPFVL